MPLETAIPASVYGNRRIADDRCLGEIDSWSSCRRGIPFQFLRQGQNIYVGSSNCRSSDAGRRRNNPDSISLVPHARPRRPRLIQEVSTKNASLSACHSERIRRSKRRGVIERYLLTTIVLKQFTVETVAKLQEPIPAVNFARN
jgi:hypothetical protein